MFSALLPLSLSLSCRTRTIPGSLRTVVEHGHILSTGLLRRLFSFLFRQHTRWYGEASNERETPASSSLPVSLFFVLHRLYLRRYYAQSCSSEPVDASSLPNAYVSPSRFDFGVRMSHHSHPSLSCFFWRSLPPPRFLSLSIRAMGHIFRAFSRYGEERWVAMSCFLFFLFFVAALR